jgi:hypothetical protein
LNKYFLFPDINQAVYEGKKFITGGKLIKRVLLFGFGQLLPYSLLNKDIDKFLNDSSSIMHEI